MDLKQGELEAGVPFDQMDQEVVEILNDHAEVPSKGIGLTEGEAACGEIIDRTDGEEEFLHTVSMSISKITSSSKGPHGWHEDDNDDDSLPDISKSMSKIFDSLGILDQPHSFAESDPVTSINCVKQIDTSDPLIVTDLQNFMQFDKYKPDPYYKLDKLSNLTDIEEFDGPNTPIYILANLNLPTIEMVTEITRHPVLGLGFEIAAAIEMGIYVISVSPSGPAADQLCHGDRIIAVNQVDVSQATFCHAMEALLQAGSIVKITFRRFQFINDSIIY